MTSYHPLIAVSHVIGAVYAALPSTLVILASFALRGLAPILLHLPGGVECPETQVSQQRRDNTRCTRSVVPRGYSPRAAQYTNLPYDRLKAMLERLEEECLVERCEEEGKSVYRATRKGAEAYQKLHVVKVLERLGYKF